MAFTAYCSCCCNILIVVHYYTRRRCKETLHKISDFLTFVMEATNSCSSCVLSQPVVEKTPMGLPKVFTADSLKSKLLLIVYRTNGKEFTLRISDEYLITFQNVRLLAMCIRVFQNEFENFSNIL